MMKKTATFCNKGLNFIKFCGWDMLWDDLLTSLVVLFFCDLGYLHLPVYSVQVHHLLL